MALQQRIADDLKEALRLGQTERRDALRLLIAELNNERIELLRQALEREAGRLGRELTEEESAAIAAERGTSLSDGEVLAVVRRLVKRHRQSIEEFRRGRREDLVAREQAQLDVIQGYLPAQLSAEDITARARAAIAETGASGRKDMGKVMARLADLRGSADMAEVSRIVQSLLGA